MLSNEETKIVEVITSLGKRVPESLMWYELEGALQKDHDELFSLLLGLKIKGVLNFSPGGWQGRDFIFVIGLGVNR